MGRTLTPQDAHVLMNILVKEATGQDSSIQVVDSSTFVSAGEQLLATGTENVLNALSLVLGRTFMAVRPYKAKLAIIDALNTGMYTSRLRKISFYSRESVTSGDFNTQVKTNFSPSYDNGSNGGASVGSMWVQNQPVPLELNFAGSSVWQDSTTVYEYQLKTAFRSESEFLQFVSGIMTEKGNDIESQKEAFNRLTLLNFMAGVYDLNQSGCVRNLTEEFNSKFGTKYTSAQLRSTYLKEFLEFFVAEFKLASDYMTHRSAKYHWSPTKTIGGTSYTLLRHTPKANQKAVLFNPLFVEAKSTVMPEIFNPQYLDIANFEAVDYWQNFNDPAAINVTPAIPDTAGTEQKDGKNVSLPYVVGMLFDRDALMIDYQLESAETTPLEARKRYRNIWWSFSRNSINDFTENAILFIMKDKD